MTRHAISFLFASAFLLAACGETNTTAPSEEGNANIQALSGLRTGINENRIDEVDPTRVEEAAQNIDPFKYGLDYTVYEREVLDGLLADARAEEDYLSRSLAATQTSLPVVRPGKSFEAYQVAMSCAVTSDVLGRRGLLVPHEALDNAINFTELAVTITAEEMESEGFLAFEEEMVDLQENGTALDRFDHRRALEAEETRLRTRHYLNYFLLRDQKLEAPDTEVLQAELSYCLETFEQDIEALIVAREAAEAAAAAE